MAQILDARGNPFQGQLDAIGGETVTDARAATATLAALNSVVLIDLNGKAVVVYDVRAVAALNMTFVVEGTVDGINYYTLPIFVNQQLLAAAIVQETYLAAVVTGAVASMSGLYTVGVSGFRRVRLRISTYGSGSIAVAARASIADQVIQTRPIPANLHVTATAAANTAATATLPGVAGMFHYITSIEITRNATAALAGTATLIHTSTNLPGTPAWSVGNAMAAGGTQSDVEYTPTTPLKSLVAGTATTVVAAAGGAAVLGRVNVSYYLGF
tara:strand:+ start:9396 stop:10208 length:813 start_codon:yes stop_codon:yes gene_type:complete